MYVLTTLGAMALAGYFWYGGQFVHPAMPMVVLALSFFGFLLDRAYVEYLRHYHNDEYLRDIAGVGK